MDILEGKFDWKVRNNDDEGYYDHKRITYNLKWLRTLVDNEDVKGIMHYLRSRLVRNLGGMGNKQLYTHLRCGTKAIIEEYLNEVVRALQFLSVVEHEDINIDDKMAFFNETRHAFGRTALLLSGGGTLGLYHIGLIRALVQNNLLPRVISGSSVGSIVTAVLGVRTDAEILEIDKPGNIDLKFFEYETVWNAFQRYFKTGALMDILALQRCIRANVGDCTFQEAFERTGRIINITISPTDSNKDIPHLLNYLSAPNVLVWSASCASCAIPNIFAPVELMAKDCDGNIIPYYAEGDVKFADGSVYIDLPMHRLSELFNVNHFVVSQVNPHVLPFVLPDTYLTSIVYKLIRYLNREIKQFLVNFSDLKLIPADMRAIMLQKYMGDITFLACPSWYEFFLLLSNPSHEKFLNIMRRSEVNTWKKISAMKSRCLIEFTLDECVRRVRGAALLAQSLDEVVNDSITERRLDRSSSWSTDHFSKYTASQTLPTNSDNMLEPEMSPDRSRLLPSSSPLKSGSVFDASIYFSNANLNSNSGSKLSALTDESVFEPKLLEEMKDPSPNKNQRRNSINMGMHPSLSKQNLAIASTHFPPFRATLPRVLSDEQLLGLESNVQSTIGDLTSANSISRFSSSNNLHGLVLSQHLPSIRESRATSFIFNSSQLGSVNGNHYPSPLSTSIGGASLGGLVSDEKKDFSPYFSNNPISKNKTSNAFGLKVAMKSSASSSNLLLSDPLFPKNGNNLRKNTLNAFGLKVNMPIKE